MKCSGRKVGFTDKRSSGKKLLNLKLLIEYFHHKKSPYPERISK